MNKETFEEDKKFIIQLINGARNKTDWERLDYSPNEEFVSYYLDTFENMIKRMTVDDIRENSLNNCHEPNSGKTITDLPLFSYP